MNSLPRPSAARAFGQYSPRQLFKKGVDVLTGVVRSSGDRIAGAVTEQVHALADRIGALRPGHTARRIRLVTKIFVVAILFVAIPQFVYQRFEEADRDKMELLLRSSLDQGRLIALNIRPYLDEGGTQIPALSRTLEPLAGQHLNIRVLYRPAVASGPSGFFYVASFPALGPTYLDSERGWLQESGILKRLARSCREDEAIGIRHVAPNSSEQLIAAITPVQTAAGCWAVVTSYPEQEFLSTSLGKAYWEAPEVQFAGLLYVALASFVIIVMLRISGSLRNFRRIAIDIGRHGHRESRSFVELNQTPELDEVAVEFDKMVDRLGTLSFSVERSPNPIVITDASWSIEFVNPAFTKLIGYDEAEILGRDPRILMADMSQTWLWIEIRDCIARGQVWEGEYLSRRRDRTTYWAELSVYRLSGSRDKPERLVWIQQDISERKRLMTELTDAKNRAECATSTKSAFLANMSHELRTPLNAILGFSEIVGNELFGRCNVPRYIEYANNIHESGAHLLTLINDILDLSKLEAGRVTLNPEQLAFHDVAAEVLKLLSAQASERQIRLGAAGDASAVTLFADRRSLKQILINLISNSLKYTPEGGSVTVSARRLSSGATAVTVADTGAGIDESDLPTVMDPYAQGRADYVRHKEGTGLGLPIVKRLAELHGGAVRIVSARGAGTTVEAIFPDRAIDDRDSEVPSVLSASAG